MARLGGEGVQAQYYEAWERGALALPRGLMLIQHGPCQSPVLLNNYTPGMLDWMVTRSVPCRKCGACLGRRKAEWSRRIRLELDAAERTWFVTLTLGPSARRNLYATLSGTLMGDGERRAHVYIQKLVTKYLDRLRHRSPGVRYVVAIEPHKDGTPHVHLLVHERGHATRKRHLREAWPDGFTTARLVEDKAGAAKYVTKYLTKVLAARIRAARGYGRSERSEGL